MPSANGADGHEGKLAVSDIFLYGTLSHIELLERVLDRPRDRIDLSGAELRDHAVFGARDQAFPVLIPKPGQRARGVLARNLGADDVARLQFYLRTQDREICNLEVETDSGERVAADIFSAPPDQSQTDEPWSLDNWVRDWGDLTLYVADEIMRHFGRLDASEVAALVPAMCRRADSYLAAQRRAAEPGQAVDRDVEVIAGSQPYTGFLAIQKMDLKFRRHDGTMSDVHTREALMASQAVVVLPYDPERDCVLLIQQFRAPLFINGDPAPWVWEPVAGQVDPGESPETTADREAMEEAGLSLRALEPAGQVYSSTGSSTEFLYLFIGLADLSVRPEGGGLDSEGEDILTRILSFDELIAGVDAQRFRDLPLVTTALWLARHRDRLRQIA